jgi:hypothetical protein
MYKSKDVEVSTDPKKYSSKATVESSKPQGKENTYMGPDRPSSASDRDARRGKDAGEMGKKWHEMFDK